MSASAANIAVHIERLVLDGLSLSRVEGLTLQRALETELARLLRAPYLTDALGLGGAVATLRTPTIAFSAASTPTQMGREIAKMVHAGLAQPVSQKSTVDHAKTASSSAATTPGARK